MKKIILLVFIVLLFGCAGMNGYDERENKSATGLPNFQNRDLVTAAKLNAMINAQDDTWAAVAAIQTFKTTVEGITGLVFSDSDGTFTDLSDISGSEVLQLNGITDLRNAEDTLTTGSNVPDGLAIYNYLVAYYLPISVDLTNPTDDTWQGKTAPGVAGETLTGKQRKVLYRKDTGSGPRYYLYSADSTDSDNDTYGPVALLISPLTGTISAGDAIVVTSGAGILADDSLTIVQANVGAPIFASETAGEMTFTMPSNSGDHIVQLGTVANMESNDRDVLEISFTYPDWTID
jgi:hypothetical protein